MTPPVACGKLLIRWISSKASTGRLRLPQYHLDRRKCILSVRISSRIFSHLRCRRLRMRRARNPSWRRVRRTRRVSRARLRHARLSRRTGEFRNSTPRRMGRRRGAGTNPFRSLRTTRYLCYSSRNHHSGRALEPISASRTRRSQSAPHRKRAPLPSGAHPCLPARAAPDPL